MYDLPKAIDMSSCGLSINHQYYIAYKRCDNIFSLEVVTYKMFYHRYRVTIIIALIYCKFNHIKSEKYQLDKFRQDQWQNHLKTKYEAHLL